MTGGMDNPVGRRLHAQRRTDFHDHVLPASRRRAARRLDSRRLRRRLRQAARCDSRPSVDRAERDARAHAHGGGRAVRAGAIRIDGVRPGIREQSVRLPVQHAQGLAARADAERSDLQLRATKIFWSPTITTFIRPTCSKTPTAACSSSIRGAGTRSVVRPRSCKSRTCSGRSIAFAARQRRAVG